jgi:hypothetical protein
MLDVRIELSLSFVRCFSIDWNFLIKGVRGECFLVGIALVLDFFLVLFWSYFRGEPGERIIRQGWAQHGMLSRSKAQLPSSVNSSVRFFVLFLTLHFSLF